MKPEMKFKPLSKSSMKIYLKVCVPLLLVTMGCAFVRNMVFPLSPTPPPSPLPPTQTPSPAPTATLVAEIETPTARPRLCTDEACLNACLDRLNRVFKERPLEPIGNDIYEEQGAKFDLVIYKVDGDKISDPTVLYVPSEYRKYQKDTEAHRQIWNFYITFIPPELRSTIKSFTVFTDGPAEIAAWVSRADDGKDYSKVGFDLLDSTYPPFLADTVAHETAHLLTLNSSQMQKDDNRYHYYDAKNDEFFDCEQYAAKGSCSLPDSYVNLFYQKFWRDSYAEWHKVEQKASKASEDEYWEIMETEFHDKHRHWFVDSYAATALEEDMAESFAYFVLNPRPKVKWVYEQKIDFYYDFPELVEYRWQMIEGLCSYVK